VGLRAEEALKELGLRARHVPTTPNVGWPAEAERDGTVVCDWGRERFRWRPGEAWPPARSEEAQP